MVFLFLAIFLILLGCIFFVLTATYTNRVTLIGQVVPSSGLVKVISPQSGAVKSISVKEGQFVSIGQELYRISSERQTAFGNVQSLVSDTITKRSTSLTNDVEKTAMLNRIINDALRQRIDSLSKEISSLRLEMHTAETQQKLLAEIATAYQGLLKKNYVTREQYIQKQSDYLQAQSRLLALRRDQTVINREIDARYAEIAENDIKSERDTNQISRQISTLSQDLAENEIRREIIVSAPQSGTVTAINGIIGNNIDASQPLVSIIPIDKELHVELYATSKSIGFVEQGQKVMLRFAAFPFQKLGHVEGVVASITSAALQNNEIPGALMAKSGVNDVESLYKIRVILSAQNIRDHGRTRAFHPGMRVEGDIMLETRTLFEWMLDPLYSITEKY